MKNLKILISGPTGSGKTTMARDLAAHFGLTLLAEDMKGIYQAKTAYEALKQRTPKNEQEIRVAYNAWANSFVYWARRRAALYETSEGFVADRWEADLLSLWVREFKHPQANRTTQELFEQMRERAASVDAIVFLLPIHASVEKKNDDGLSRNSSLGVRLMATLLTDGLIRQCNGARVIYVPDQPMSREDRAQLVIQEISRDGRK